MKHRFSVRAGGARVGKGDRGSAAVEFALVLPLILTVALALLQVGLIAKDQLVLTGAARAGAREGAVTSDDESVRAAALDAAVSLERRSIDVTVHRGGERGAPVTVTVLYRVPIVVPIVRWLFPSAVELSSTATMRQETQ